MASFAKICNFFACQQVPPRGAIIDVLKSLCHVNFEEAVSKRSYKLFDDVAMLHGSFGMFLVSMKSFLVLFIIMLLNGLWFERFDIGC